MRVSYRPSFWIVSLVCVLGIPTGLWAGPQEESLETARLLATLLDSGRVTIAKHQDLINAPTGSGTRFTASLFRTDTIKEFQGRTGVNLADLEQASVPPMAKPLLTQLLQTSVRTVESFEPVLNLPAMKYKGLIPATFGTETASRFQALTQIYLKQTAPNGLVRNQKNKPDAYESAALTKLAADPIAPSDRQGFGEIVEDGQAARLIMPLYYAKACLMCHGEPKGERDISGFPREGAKEGDLGGAISVKIPLK